MSLLVWLPMTKDLTQQGISDITVTNNGATLSTNGKLGKCYYFDGNAHYLQFSKSVGDLYSGDFSYAVWLKPTDDTRSIICSEYSSSGASGIAFELTASRQIRLYWNGSPDIYATGCVLPKDVWTHCAITRSGNVAKFYMNGILTYTYEGTLTNKTSTANIRLGDDYRGGTSVTYMGYMNDFRLYNHCLSAKEVEILSRGLVAHYPLSGGRGGIDNLIDYSKVTQANFTTLINRGKGSWNKLSLVTKDGYDCYLYDKSLSSTAFSSGAWYSLMKANTTYTYSAWIYFTASANFNFTSLGHFQVYNSNSTASDKSHEDIVADRIYEPSTISANKWTKIRITFTTNDLANSYFQIYPRYNIGANVGDLYFRDCKLEEGDHPTSWTPNPVDPEYTKMGYNSTTEYDVSGYENNMTKTGTITYISDSARYSVSSHFINGSYLMANQNSTEYLPKDSLTVNLWVKPSTWSNPISCTEGGGWNFEGNPVQFPCYISGVGYKVAASNVTGASLQDGKWHMLTGTYSSKDQQVKIYVDGVLKATTATGSSNNIGYASNRLIISGEAQSTTPASSGFVGEESDVRIYATALTADQVLDLYKSSASVANNGTLIGYEFIEN